MPGEFLSESGRLFMNKVCFFLDGKYGFNVYQNCYEGEDAASVTAQGEKIRFDFVMYQHRRKPLTSQTIKEYKFHLFCECKYRSNPRDLECKLKEFLQKAIKAAPVLERSFSGNFFLFITNKYFGISQEDLEERNFLENFIKNNDTSAISLHGRVGILVLPEWFLETTSMGV